mmetsp:Transcript_54645/g.111583  ORF Transcript_54645/g.111583 Transcript_54645/m.111583 type:complete len:141 (+) Transcript_54645:281-703(+)|eukprot:CAMPEP_0181323392 /NCGR_PEP_ID=MMETSP1101-20121128/19761_1 /TAXON_ID=46948 /ORGANISM="Rhodomonas abbreviata, Strain Caron Lab Isolate" /LENGTH=140 /DNA_ID=CAMNT_0023431417 /DNA_START=291 /DNA_END=713 /DNA_ORIENTATION=-
MGNEIYLARVTASGVEIGETFMRYMALLDLSDVQPEAPFLCPTLPSGLLRVPRTGTGFNPTQADCLRHCLSQVFQELHDNPALLAQFSWHSLRRGGASHAHHNHVPIHDIMGHGVWRSEEGISPYINSDFRGKIGVSASM